MEWKEYIRELLQTESEFDRLTISLDNEVGSIRVPAVVKASILMLDEILEHQGKHNVFVFPEKNHTGFLFMLMTLIHSIYLGKIQHEYDPSKFQPGEKLKLGNAVVEFIGTATIDGKPYIRLRTSDIIYSAPVGIVPQLQHTDTAKKLSTYQKFSTAKREITAKNKLADMLDSPVAALENDKSHMDSSIFYMAPVITTKKQIAECSLDNEPVQKIMMVAQASYEGLIQNIGPGQIKGIPAIVLSSDLYSIDAAIDKGHPAQSLILDISNQTQMLSQLDALDRLLLHDFPILCYTDTANSTGLSYLVERGFNVWRWDKQSLESSFYTDTGSGDTLLERRLKNCASQVIAHSIVEDKDLTDTAACIFKHQRDLDSMSPQLQKAYEGLCRLLFGALRETIGTTPDDQNRTLKELDRISNVLKLDFSYISSEAMEDYKGAVNKLRAFFTEGHIPAKHSAMLEQLKLHSGEDVCIVIPEHSDKTKVLTHWRQQCLANKIKVNLTVYYPSDYMGLPLQRFQTTIIVGWFRRVIMRKLLLSYKTPCIAILLYPQENKWCRFDEHRWKKEFRQTDNNTIVKHYLSTGKRSIAFAELPALEDIRGEDQDDIEKTLHEGRYKRFAGSSGQAGVQPVKALPVNFVGGFVGFFRPSHSLISATRIITEDSDKIQSVLPEKLSVGDFIVIRETDKDLIRELADHFLEASGKANYRELSSKWRDALKIELLFETFESFCEKLKAAGCTKSKPTIANWCNDEDMIAPQDKEDLRCIAEVSGDQVLLELLDSIYDAARDVKAAHTQAGMELSGLLRSRIADELKKYGDIDPFNIWEPIEMEIEGIGLVRILKVIDVNEHQMITMDSTMTNRLMNDD